METVYIEKKHIPSCLAEPTNRLQSLIYNFLPFTESVDEEGVDGDQEDSEENKLANFIKYIQETKVRSA